MSYTRNKADKDARSISSFQSEKDIVILECDKNKLLLLFDKIIANRKTRGNQALKVKEKWRDEVMSFFAEL